MLVSPWGCSRLVPGDGSEGGGFEATIVVHAEGGRRAEHVCGASRVGVHVAEAWCGVVGGVNVGGVAPTSTYYRRVIIGMVL